MELIYYYLIFALTTGFCSLYELFQPVWYKVKKDNAKDMVSKHGFSVGLVFFVFAVVGAPIAVLACIVPSWGESFRANFHKSLVHEG